MKVIYLVEKMRLEPRTIKKLGYRKLPVLAIDPKPCVTIVTSVTTAMTFHVLQREMNKKFLVRDRVISKKNF